MPRKRKRSRSAARGGRSRSAPAPKRAVAGHGSAPVEKRVEAGPRRAPALKRAAAGTGVPGHAIRSLDNWLLGLAVLGVLLTGYLTLVAWFGEHPAYCGADSECDLVQSSRWSTLFGMPIALWGLLTYALLAGLAWRLRSRASAWRTTLLVACVGVGVSWFLTLVSVLQIEATCGYCLASFALMNVLLVLVLLRRPSQMPEHAWRKSLPFPIGVAIALVLGLHLHFSGVFDPAAGPEDPYLKSLATHLRDSGARFYGAYWCPACQEQKALFTASVDRLPYVECTPEGRGGTRAVDCLTRNIQDYPTWIIDGQRYTGVIGVERLARVSKFDSSGTTRESAPDG